MKCIFTLFLLLAAIATGAQGNFAYVIFISQDTVTAKVLKYPGDFYYYKTLTGRSFIIHSALKYESWGRIDTSNIVQLPLDSFSTVEPFKI